MTKNDSMEDGAWNFDRMSKMFFFCFVWFTQNNGTAPHHLTIEQIVHFKSEQPIYFQPISSIVISSGVFKTRIQKTDMQLICIIYEITIEVYCLMEFFLTLTWVPIFTPLSISFQLQLHWLLTDRKFTLIYTEPLYLLFFDEQLHNYEKIKSWKGRDMV